MDLDSKVVLITGAARGIGQATAEAFVARGARVVVTDLDEDAITHAVPEAVLAFRADVTSEKEVEAMVSRCIDETGDLDIMINNAGVSVSGPAEAIPIEDWRWIVDVNLWSHVYGIRAALPHLKKKGSGHLVHVASAAGIFGTPAAAPYCMTKFAVFGLAESLATSLHGSGIGVSVVCPQWVDTDIALHSRVTVPDHGDASSDDLVRMSREMMKSAGIPASRVAEAIVEGVEQNQFLVLPHPEILALAQKKWSNPNWYVGRAAEALKAQGKLFGE